MVAEKLNRDNGIAATQKQIMVTAGAKDSIRITIMATLNLGDEVLVIDPS